MGDHELLSSWGRPSQHAEVYELPHVRPQWVVPPQMDASVVDKEREQNVCQFAVVRRACNRMYEVIGAYPPER